MSRAVTSGGARLDAWGWVSEWILIEEPRLERDRLHILDMVTVC